MLTADYTPSLHLTCLYTQQTKCENVDLQTADYTCQPHALVIPYVPLSHLKRDVCTVCLQDLRIYKSPRRLLSGALPPCIATPEANDVEASHARGDGALP